MSPNFLWAVRVPLSLLVFFHDCDGFEKYWVGSCRMSIDLSLSDIFLMDRWQVGLGRKTTEKCSSYHIISRECTPTWLITVKLTLTSESFNGATSSSLRHVTLLRIMVYTSLAFSAPFYKGRPLRWGPDLRHCNCTQSILLNLNHFF